MNRAQPWSAEDDLLLRALARQGLSEAEISEKIGRAKSSVRKRAADIRVAIARDWNGAKQRPLAVRSEKDRGNGLTWMFEDTWRAPFEGSRRAKGFLLPWRARDER